MRTKTRIAILSFVVVCSLAWVSPAAADTIDQSYQGSGVSFAINHCCAYVGQTYTAGLNGTLTGVNVQVSTSQSSYDMQIAIYSVLNGLPTGTVLTSTTLPAGFSPGSGFPSFLVTFPDAIAQIAGTQYAIVATFPGAPTFYGGWWYGGFNGYAGGTSVVSHDGVNFYDLYNDAYDLNFQTHVDIPEPGTLLLLAAGLAGLALRRRFAS